MNVTETPTRKGTAMQTVGSFTYDPDSGSITGPAAYLDSENYRRVIDRIKKGEDPCGAFAFSPDPITAALVTIQTAYAAWSGMRALELQLTGRNGS